MQLKKLELQGFKSFADKTEIEFLDGVTTIVGPNGSGKSNISDSLRWVLGEQSTKSLRGSKMEDVIFAGTQARKKQGFAEVSMTLDNSDMSLPIDFKEVVITRRIYRTGESNYLINGSECRLKDIQELFMDTGVGKDGYSIISQGKIDEILSSKSEERRHIFEEAAGIVKYRTRKEEATKKLENTNVTLDRVNDILVEIENVIGPLEKKAETAKKYLALRDELKSYDVHLFIKLLDDNNKNLAELDNIISDINKAIETCENDGKGFESKKNELKERINEITLKIEETQAKFFETQNETEKVNSKIKVFEAQIEYSNDNIKRLELEVKEDQEKIEILKEEINTKLKKRNSMAENKKRFEEELAEKEEELNKLTQNMDEKELEIESIKKDIDEKTEEKYNIKTSISNFYTVIDESKAQLENTLKNFDKNLTQKDSINAEKTDIYTELNSKNQNLKQAEENLDKINLKREEVLAEYDEISKKSETLKEEIMTLRSKLTYLKNLETENEGYQKSVKAVLDYAKENNLNSVYGTVASLISTNEKYEYAIEIALGGFLQNIVVETEEEAKVLVNYLKDNTLGRATFLPLNKIRKVKNDKYLNLKNADGFLGMATELVNYNDKYEDAINLALNNIAIVDNIENALNISKKFKNQIRLVTLSGELIAQTGSITGGRTSRKSTGLIGRTEKINELKRLIDKKQEKIDKIGVKFNSIDEKLKEINNEYDKLKKDEEQLKIEVATCSLKYENVKKEIEKLEKSHENYEVQKSNLELRIKENEELIETSNGKLEVLEKDINEKQDIIDEYARFNKEKQQQIDYLNEDVVNLKISLSSFDESVASIDEMKEKIEQDIVNFENLIVKKVGQSNELKSSIIDNTNEIQKLNSSIEEMQSFKGEFEKISSNLRKEKEDCDKLQEDIDKKILDNIKQIENKKSEKMKFENKKVKYDIEVQNLKTKMWEDYELTISSAKALIESLPVIDKDANIQKLADKIRKEIKDLGEVNVSAIDEYRETKERYDFITTQKKDLEETKQKLNNLISNMTTIMKQQFAKQFKVIRENFNETFKELFGGGKAELTLTDEANILESGIDITVEPPGKKLQNMMLLSGGERALTATALLFAILKIKTPPFCILDEIEAALDDVNVQRFAEYIKKYSNKTQFIVITHRKGTMEVATCTYGVTMQEYGISKVVSMKLK